MADPYTVVDPVLIPWAEKHDLEIEKKDRGDYVRSIWLYGDHGRAQMWLHLPKTDNAVVVKVLVAELDLSRPTKWGRREERAVNLAGLEQVLDELLRVVIDWVGPRRVRL